MRDYDYLTEHEKRLFCYTEYVPCEYPPLEDKWYDDESIEIDALNDIFNL